MGAVRKFWSWIECKLDGHFSVGHLTVYGANAMHWAVNYWTKRWGYVCFRLPLPCNGHWWPLYFYVSPNATPWAATYHVRQVGEGLLAPFRRDRLADLRGARFGHGFDSDGCYPELRALNDENYRLEWDASA